MRTLLVEDDAIVADAIGAGLRDAGFPVDRVESAERADTALRTGHYELLILDIGLPGASGLDLLRRVRARGLRVPVLILTARDGMDDRVEGLDLGADDYMVKPFELRELVARCRALVRRTGQASSGTLRFGALCMSMPRRTLTIDGVPVDLPPREWAVIEYLLLHAGTVVPKVRLLQAISDWDDSLGANAIEVYVSRLRQKLAGAGVELRTVRGVGYRLEEAPR